MSDGPRVSRVGGVVVEYRSGDHLDRAVDSLLREGVAPLVVVDNSGAGTARPELGARRSEQLHVLDPGRNLGFGAGANRGVAALESELVVISNPDVVVHEGALDELVAALDAHPTWAIVGPTILNEDGTRYPSVRRFPSMLDAVGHASLGRVWPSNPFTRRYREAGAEPDGRADWVSGSCFVVRRAAFERIGGFDERYFMFAEDMDLCWRAHAAGFEVGTAPGAIVTHVEGVSRRGAPRRMLVAHHVSALRFASRTTSGPKRLLLPLAAMLLAARLAAMLVLPNRVKASLRRR